MLIASKVALISVLSGIRVWIVAECERSPRSPCEQARPHVQVTSTH